LRYAALGLPIGAVATWIVWNGAITGVQGAVLVGLYVVYVAVIWTVERHPPMLGEAGEIEEARERRASRLLKKSSSPGRGERMESKDPPF
jgi:cation:H+ antiporter